MRILRGLNSQLLPCGCLLGVYETYDGLVVRLIDAVSETCTTSGHRQGTLVPAAVSTDAGARAAAAETTRQSGAS